MLVSGQPFSFVDARSMLGVVLPANLLLPVRIAVTDPRPCNAKTFSARLLDLSVAATGECLMSRH
jgi:hypothetical protein